MISFEERVKGVLISTALGDALGAPIEKLSREEIEEKYGYVTSLKTLWYKEALGEDATLGKRRGNGIITDDTLMTLALCRVYKTEKRHLDAYDLANEFTKEIAFRKTFIPEFNRKAPILDRLFYPEKHIFLRHVLANCEPRQGGIGNMVNCGAAMYIAPIGIVNAGNPLAAYNEAIAFASGHQVSYGLEAAGVLAACVACAFTPNATVENVVETAITVAKDGTKQAIIALTTKAEELKKRKCSYHELVKSFHDSIAPFSPMGDDVHRKIEKVGIPSNHYTPSRLFSIEELPLALAFIVYNDGEYYKSILDGVNSGRDTDSIGVMVGVILGAMYGTKFIEEEDIDLLSRTNQINFDNEATSFGEVAKQIIKKDLQIIRKQEGIIGH
ncbi:ADP-ribosylglycohydrolase family protein [Ureibacillus chungkukjangi]|uniref:ADP-ribosylglycohydrolase n=1 Tax=Ureibacillus chungkukjangi TaxID=1202712 RepID=A0A318U3R7_9BACL|nr:ADP-ribosylglycohydrolase family protein [Ureibacillus chungkukjangi]MCM3387499.1 ADP-ribosylglycohydrolase family protein [Ureibacillus chungkukjangi]PYF09015.1 ADP-ribosylglycohydrolase [Ureibacillus chungkukjangi]